MQQGALGRGRSAASGAQHGALGVHEEAWALNMRGMIEHGSLSMGPRRVARQGALSLWRSTWGGRLEGAPSIAPCYTLCAHPPTHKGLHALIPTRPRASMMHTMNGTHTCMYLMNVLV